MEALPTTSSTIDARRMQQLPTTSRYRFRRVNVCGVRSTNDARDESLAFDKIMWPTDSCGFASFIYMEHEVAICRCLRAFLSVCLSTLNANGQTEGHASLAQQDYGQGFSKAGVRFSWQQQINRKAQCEGMLPIAKQLHQA